ncbi:MAG TPA: hypothetical protein VFS20_32475 [Longimicrobium sp.]|nr:hypothetical protein [Longimicrobium sp.]
MLPRWLHALNSSPPCDTFALARRRAKEIRSQFGHDPEFRQFEQAVYVWQTDAEGCSRLRAAAAALPRGEVAHENARVLLRTVAQASPDAPRLYRGMWVRITEWEVLAEATVGAHVDIALASFTSEFNWALDFAWLGSDDEEGTEVVLCLEPGAQAVRNDLLAPDEVHWRAREWITGGRFLVTASGYLSNEGRVELSLVHEGAFHAR